MSTESEYVLTEAETESVTDSDSSLEPDEVDDLITNIYEYSKEYLEANILSISSPLFYENMKRNVTDLLIIDLETAGYTDMGGEEMDEFIEQNINDVLEFLHIPPRQIRYSIGEGLNDSTKNMEKMQDQIITLQSLPQPTQRTEEWYQYRYNLITASNLWKVFGTDANKNSLIYEKCKPFEQINSQYVNTESPMHRGIKYEPVSVILYESMFRTKLADFGCIQHPTYPFIGASPDGINIDVENKLLYGRMLEIKNVVNREITGIPKEEYWVQTQIQMETCDLDECDFFETRFLEYSCENDFYLDVDREHRGIILHFISNNITTINAAVPFYIYMPLDIDLTKDAVQEWINEVKIQQKSNDQVLFNVVYWYLEEYSCVLIKRNRQWFQEAISQIQDIWDIIVKERTNGYEHRAAKKRTPKTSVTTDTSNVHIIHNMKPNNTICLVRLDR